MNWHQAELDEVLRDAAESKEQGNALFKEGKFALARKKYEGTVARLKGLRGLDEAEEEAAQALKLQCHLNLAACLQKLGEHAQAVLQCSEALDKCDAENVKALYRRATSLIVLSRFEEARADLADAEALAQEDAATLADVRRLQAKVAAAEKAAAVKDKREFGGFLDKGQQGGGKAGGAKKGGGAGGEAGKIVIEDDDDDDGEE